VVPAPSLLRVPLGGRPCLIVLLEISLGSADQTPRACLQIKSELATVTCNLRLQGTPTPPPRWWSSLCWLAKAAQVNFYPSKK
jgi:hypothetical protein